MSRWQQAHAVSVPAQMRARVRRVARAAAGWLLLITLGASGPARAQEPRFTIAGDAAFDSLGAASAVVGDVDGDAVADLVIGEPYATNATSGAARLVSGVDGALLQSWVGSGRDDQLGFAVAAPGDLDGDGVGDVLLGMPNYAGSAVAGTVLVQSGATGAQLRSHAGASPGAAFGAAIAALADLDGDGVREYVVGAPGKSMFHVFDGASGSELHQFTSLQAGSNVGWCVAATGDVDGDRVADLLVSAPFWRAASGIVTGRVQVRSGATGAALRDHFGENASQFLQDWYGATLADLGDVDGDGFPDYAIGALAFGHCQQGRVYVHSGASGAELHRLDGAECGTQLGIAIATAGDADRDGRNDLLLGEPHHGSDLRGRVRIVSGVDLRALSGIEGSPGERLGAALGAAADLDGDQVPELLSAAIGPVDSYTGTLAVHSCAPPTLATMMPERGHHAGVTTVILDGAAWRAEAGFVVTVGGAAVDLLSHLDSTECTFDLPAGVAGPVEVVAATAFGRASATFFRTPAGLVEGDLSPGGSGSWITLLDPGDSAILLAGLPPRVTIPLPPYSGELGILPFVVVWIEPNAQGDALPVDFEIEDDPSLSGLVVLAQALAGPQLGGRKKDGSFSNVVEFTIE
ncbi:MAG: hypothetical protein FJ293_02375 [Planctomycetes bacterium]|nr:hypothetical protein [Planctomycetota bacterium]